MNTFKVGDKVKCIEEDASTIYAGLKAGNEYTVSKLGTYNCISLFGVNQMWHSSRFVLVEPKQSHPYADVILAWANGSEVQYKNLNGNWVDFLPPSPDKFIREWRIKPEPVYEWKWIWKTCKGEYIVTYGYYKTKEEANALFDNKIIDKIEDSKREVKE